MVCGQSASCTHALALVSISLAGKISYFVLFHLSSRDLLRCKARVWFQSMVPDLCCIRIVVGIQPFSSTYMRPCVLFLQTLSHPYSKAGMWGGCIILWCSVLFCHSGWEGEAAIGFHEICLRANASSNSITFPAFPGELGFDQGGTGATYLGRTEKQMSTRGSCSQMCMPQRCAGVGMSRHRVASEAPLPQHGLVFPLSLCTECLLLCGCK